MGFSGRKDFSQLAIRSLKKLAAILTLGIGGGLGGYASLSKSSNRLEFIADYALVSLYLAMILTASYRLLLYCDFVGGLHFYIRRAIFIFMLSPAIYVLFLGEIRRLNHIGLWRGFVLLNFASIYGACGLFALLCLLGRIFKGGK